MWGRGLHFRTCNRKSGTAYLFYPQIPYKIGISETFYPNQTQNTTSVMSSTKRPFYAILPILTQLKITTIPPKTTSNPYKSILHSNSTKNHIFNNKISPHKPPKSNHKITQNISKINTFQPYQIHKQHYSIEVIIFIIKNHIKIFTLIPTQKEK